LKQKITGCGITDDSGRLIGNLSVNDLKNLAFSLEYFNLLSQPLSKYLQMIKEKDTKNVELRADFFGVLCATEEVT
jgi:hypothetical protein